MSDMHTPRPAQEPRKIPAEHVDALIIGAGAAGSLWAQRLASAGKSVVVLEAGPAWELRDLISSQIWARRLKWGGAPVLSGPQDSFGHNMSTGWGLGGAALHHYAGWPRLHSEDFRTFSLYGRGRDWPIVYEELQPWYDRIQAEMVLSGDAQAEVWRPPGDPYPQPPLPTFHQGNVIAKGFASLGMRVAPAPLAILSRPSGARMQCLYDGWCDAGCPIGAIANPLVTHIPRARAAGAHFETRATATRILMDGRGRAAGVMWRDVHGVERTQRADLIVLAASTVQNVRLLLASSERRHRNGVPHQPLIGAGFTCHTVASVYGIFQERMDNHLGVTAGQLISQEHYAKNAHGKDGPLGSHQWGIAPALKPNDLLGIANTRPELYGRSLAQFIESDGPRIGTMSAVCETLPAAGRRIELAPAVDLNGVPLARIVNVFDRDAVGLFDAVNQTGRQVLQAAGAKSTWSGVRASTHPLGGTIMGTDAAHSVCDSFGQMHQIPNLFISGGSLFPTAGGGSPTFTLYALADRASHHVLTHKADYL